MPLLEFYDLEMYSDAFEQEQILREELDRDQLENPEAMMMLEEGLRDCVGSATTTSHFPNPRLPYALEASKRFITRKFTSPATTPSNCPWLETGFLK